LRGRVREKHEEKIGNGHYFAISERWGEYYDYYRILPWYRNVNL